MKTERSEEWEMKSEKESEDEGKGTKKWNKNTKCVVLCNFVLIQSKIYRLLLSCYCIFILYFFFVTTCYFVLSLYVVIFCYHELFVVIYYFILLSNMTVFVCVCFFVYLGVLICSCGIHYCSYDTLSYAYDHIYLMYH